MSLKYTLTENRLNAAQPDEYLARPQEVKSHDLESIISKITNKNNNTRAVAKSVLDDFFAVFKEITAEGETINTDLIKTNFSISGVFHGATMPFDKNHHTVKINTNPGKILKDAVGDVHTEKIDSAEVMPHILEVKDSVSGSVNEHITSQGVLDLVGSLLKIEGDSPLNGVVLIDSTGKPHKIKTLIENKPSRLFVMLPKLDKGEYTLQVTTQYSGGATDLKSPRTGTFDRPLTVV